MLTTVIKNIGCLVTCRSNAIKTGESLNDAGIIDDGFVVIEEDKILAVGKGEDYKKYLKEDTTIINGENMTVTPGLIDSHTHVVYGGSREKELALKLNNVSYIEILNNGGGILSTVRNTRKADLDILSEDTKKRLDLMLLHGTTTIESKSGYGLNLEDEIKMLNVNKKLNDEHPIDIVSTYLGAHAIPEEYKENRDGYIDLMINKVIPYVVKNKLADFIDCFCEEGVFSVEESRRILKAGANKGLKVKIHADEIKPIGGAELAAELNATSAEHLVGASLEGIKELANKGVVAVLLPSTSFYLMLNKFADARTMIKENVPIALATDCNPGTSPTESLQNVMTFACFGMRLTPEEIINSMTINAAYAIGKNDEIGSIEPGKKADLVIFNSKSLNYLIYHFGINSVKSVIKNGKLVVDDNKIVERW